MMKTPEQLKVTELKEELKRRGMSPKGLKKELVERLEGALRVEAMAKAEAASAAASAAMQEGGAPEEAPEAPQAAQEEKEEDLAAKTVEEQQELEQEQAPAPPAPLPEVAEETETEINPASLVETVDTTAATTTTATTTTTTTMVTNVDEMESIVEETVVETVQVGNLNQPAAAEETVVEETVVETVKVVEVEVTPAAAAAAAVAAMEEGGAAAAITAAADAMEEESKIASEAAAATADEVIAAVEAMEESAKVVTEDALDDAKVESFEKIEQEHGGALAAETEAETEKAAVVEYPKDLPEETVEALKDVNEALKEALKEELNEGQIKDEDPKLKNSVDEKESLDDMDNLDGDTAKIDDSKTMDVDADAEAQAGLKRKDYGEQQIDQSKRQRRWNSGKNLGADAKVSPDLIVDDGSSLAGSITRPALSRPALSPPRSDAASNGRTVSPSAKNPTTSLRIDRFVRPFTLKALKDLLADTGNLVDFWMDQIKTHCYVTYSSVDEAVATRNALHNLKWPVIGGKQLVAEYVEPEEVKLKVESGSSNDSKPSVTLPRGVPAAAFPSPHAPVSPVAAPLPALHKEKPAPPPKREAEPMVTLDDLFKKTSAKPNIYYLPLTEAQVAAKAVVVAKS